MATRVPSSGVLRLVAHEQRERPTLGSTRWSRLVLDNDVAVGEAPAGGTRVVLHHYDLPGEEQTDHQRKGWELYLARLEVRAIGAAAPSGPERVARSPPRPYHPSMAFDDGLAERLRDRLREATGVNEKKMFGGLAFLTDGNMTVGVHGDDLIARIAPDETAGALAEPGVRPFDITGRPMRGWVLVAGEALDDAVLDRWAEQARAFVATLPPK